MNLSCGNCKAIQSFSGDPPKCDVCGWVRGTEVKRTARPLTVIIRQIISRLLGVVAVLILFGIVWTYWVMPEKQRLAEEYRVNQDQVSVEPKPHGCDFDDAPLGNKHCHYEKVVDVERACPGRDCRVTGVYESWKKVDE